MQSSVRDAIQRLLIHEGGYVNHPSDPGGPTNFGITLADYRRYVKPNGTAADVRAMSKNTAISIYEKKYWDSCRLDEVAAGVDYALFDYGVNSGIGRSGKVARRVCGLADNVSTFNDAVIAALNARPPKALISSICNERRRFLRSLKTYPVFSKGWERRVNEVESFSKFLADKPANAISANRPATEGVANGKGEVKGSEAINTKTVGPSVVVGGGSGYALWDWIVANPIDTAVIVAILGTASFFAIRYAINRWKTAKQEAAVPFDVVPAT